jgi:hypothetical protein
MMKLIKKLKKIKLNKNLRKILLLTLSLLKKKKKKKNKNKYKKNKEKQDLNYYQSLIEKQWKKLEKLKNHNTLHQLPLQMLKLP